jgi:formylglycine-generating enzyme required for sulfatase activity
MTNFSLPKPNFFRLKFIKKRILSCLLALLLFIGTDILYAQNPSTSVKHSKSYVNKLKMKMIAVEPGSFKMGAETTKFKFGKKDDFSKDAPYYDETPVHQVTIDYPFYISETEVTADSFANLERAIKIVEILNLMRQV